MDGRAQPSVRRRRSLHGASEKADRRFDRRGGYSVEFQGILCHRRKRVRLRRRQRPNILVADGHNERRRAFGRDRPRGGSRGSQGFQEGIPHRAAHVGSERRHIVTGRKGCRSDRLAVGRFERGTGERHILAEAGARRRRLRLRVPQERRQEPVGDGSLVP